LRSRSSAPLARRHSRHRLQRHGVRDPRCLRRSDAFAERTALSRSPLPHRGGSRPDPGRDRATAPSHRNPRDV